MAADPADIARFTTDGVVITSDATAGAAVKAMHPNARMTEEGREIEMFFTNPANAQVLLDERFTLTSSGGGLHDGVEVEESIDIGGAIPISPNVPCFTVKDADGLTFTGCRTRSFARSMGNDRYAVEAMQ